LAIFKKNKINVILILLIAIQLCSCTQQRKTDFYYHATEIIAKIDDNNSGVAQNNLPEDSNKTELSASSHQSESVDLTLPLPKQNGIIAADNIPQWGNYYALIIGVNDYRHMPRLRTAISDATSIADILQHNYGFNVKLLIDPKRSQIIASLREFRNRLQKSDNFLLYYAGHGWYDEAADLAYWLPVDATQINEANWVSSATITASFKAMLAKHVIIIADSCYAGKLTRSVHIRHKTPDYYTKIAQKKARIVLSSGGSEPVVDSGGSKNHSIFASALITVLKENHGIFDGTDLFMKIRRMVVLGSDQTPEYCDVRKAGHDGGDFLFIRNE
jgi:hypothetical protein